MANFMNYSRFQKINNAPFDAMFDVSAGQNRQGKKFLNYVKLALVGQIWSIFSPNKTGAHRAYFVPSLYIIFKSTTILLLPDMTVLNDN
jgi:hypothetical protein